MSRAENSEVASKVSPIRRIAENSDWLAARTGSSVPVVSPAVTRRTLRDKSRCAASPINKTDAISTSSVAPPPAASTRVIVLTSYGNDECVAQLIRAGASGYLIKQTAASELVRAIREIRRGNYFYSSAIAKRLREIEPMISASGRISKKSAELTAREIEVLELIAGGRSNKEAAVELGISIKTVEKHRQQVMNKLNIHEVAGLTRYALSQGLVERKVPAGI